MPSIRRLPDPSREHDRILKRLEGKFDRPTKYVRDYYSALNDIKLLKDAGAIDHDHAQLLAASARKEFEEIESKKRIDKALKSNPVETIPREPRDYQAIGRFIGKVCGWVILLVIIIPAIW